MSFLKSLEKSGFRNIFDSRIGPVISKLFFGVNYFFFFKKKHFTRNRYFGETKARIGGSIGATPSKTLPIERN